MQFNGKALLLGAAFAGLVAIPAHATLQVNITDTSHPGGYTFAAGMLDCPLCDPNNVVAVINDADFSFSLNFATSTSPGQAAISVQGTENSKHAANPITIEVTDNGFMLPVGPATMTQTVEVNTAATGPTHAIGTTTATGYYAGSNALFDKGGIATPAVSFGSFDLATNSSSVPVTTTVPFALDEYLSLSFTNGGAPPTSPQGIINATLSVATVPEPASMALLGGALLFVAAGVRRRARKA